MKPLSTRYYTPYPCPIGRLVLVGDPEALTAIHFDSEQRHPEPSWRENRGVFQEAVDQLDAYFAGARTTFDLPMRMSGTDFQRRVWAELLQVPFGVTATYAQIAARIGKPTAVRAVGAANGRNPLPIVVPCHRIVGSDGSLTGYAGGLECKQFLLEHERNVREQKPNSADCIATT